MARYRCPECDYSLVYDEEDDIWCCDSCDAEWYEDQLEQEDDD